MLHVSLAEITSMQYSSCSTVSVSPTLMSAMLPSSTMPFMADSVAVMLWSIRSWPRSTASSTSRALMTLVILAMGSSWWMFLSYRTVPLSASTRMAALARMSGSSSASACGVSRVHSRQVTKKTDKKRRIFIGFFLHLCYNSNV